MPDPQSHERVKRFRQVREAQGLRETRVWLPETARARVKAMVAEGRYPNLDAAIADAIERTFTESQQM